MSNISKFLENELDRVSEYLTMAKTTLIVPSELCENNCENLSDNLDSEDLEIIKYLTDEIPVIESRINDAKEIIYNLRKITFKNKNN